MTPRVSDFVVVAFEHGQPVRTEYVPQTADAQALVEQWEAEGLHANWATSEEWERIMSRFPDSAPDEYSEQSWPLRESAEEGRTSRSSESGPVVAPRFCSGCGSPLRSGVRFCEACGQEVQAPQPNAAEETRVYASAPPAVVSPSGGSKEPRSQHRKALLLTAALLLLVATGAGCGYAAYKHLHAEHGPVIIGGTALKHHQAAPSIDKAISNAYGYSVGHCSKIKGIVTPYGAAAAPWVYYRCDGMGGYAVIDANGKVWPGGG